MMNPVPLFLIIVTLPLLLGGCGIEEPTIEIEKNGVFTVRHENGKKLWEISYKDDKKVEGSEKFWNSKGEPVDSIEEARK